MKVYPHLFVFSLFFGLISCAAVEPSPSFSIDSTLLINANGWQIIREWKEEGASTTEMLPGYDACVKDNVISFSINGYTLSEGLTPCEADIPQVIETGSWKVEGGVLTFTPTLQSSSFAVAYSFTLEKLNETEFIISFSELNASGRVVRITRRSFEPVPAI
jgi:hypothetical protein